MLPSIKNFLYLGKVKDNIILCLNIHFQMLESNSIKKKKGKKGKKEKVSIFFLNNKQLLSE